MKEENKMTTMEALVFFYRHHALTEFLTTLSDEELSSVRSNIEVDDIDDEKAGILDAIMQEMEYRSDKTIIEERNSSNKSK